MTTLFRMVVRTKQTNKQTEKKKHIIFILLYNSRIMYSLERLGFLFARDGTKRLYCNNNNNNSINMRIQMSILFVRAADQKITDAKFCDQNNIAIIIFTEVCSRICEKTLRQ